MHEPDEVRALLVAAGFNEVALKVVEDPDGNDRCATAMRSCLTAVT